MPTKSTKAKRLTRKKPVAKNKLRPRPKLTDADRHARFVETAREVGASENPTDFENAFNKIVPRRKVGAAQKS